MADADWQRRTINELAQKIIELEPLLRCMPDDTADPMWLELHLRLQELGGVPPASFLPLQHLVDGFNFLERMEE